MHRGDRDDPAPAPLVHVRQRAPDEAERRLDHDPLERANVSGGKSGSGATCWKPALLTSTSTSTSSASTAAPSVEVGHHRGAADLGRDRLARLPRCGRRRCTLAPAAASRGAQARPMPLPPPVTSAVRPVRSSRTTWWSATRSAAMAHEATRAGWTPMACRHTADPGAMWVFVSATRRRARTRPAARDPRYVDEAVLLAGRARRSPRRRRRRPRRPASRAAPAPR